MISRRSFLKASSLAAAGSLVRFPAFAYDKKHIGLQLYTVRDAMKEDPAGTLAKIAAIGYNSVEGATYTKSQSFYGMKPAEFAEQLKRNGLIMPSAHYSLGEKMEEGKPVKGTMLYEWEKAVDDAASAGITYMVLAHLDEKTERGDATHYRGVASQLNMAAETCKKAGLQMCYHNHDFEFKQVDGELPYDILLNSTDENLVKMELDLYWVSKIGVNPADLFKKYPGRFPLWHVKDMDNTPEKNFTEVGNGTIDFKKIFTYADKAGLKYFYVEQDKTPGSPFDSISKSIAYVKANLV
jgi:sugar phosphate isomerase/epimerase